MLQIDRLSYRVEGRLLFDGATVTVAAGQKIGLVGRNGSGKTTLLRLIAAELGTDGGSITLPAGTRVGRVAQEAPGGAERLIDAVLHADAERSALMVEAERTSDPTRIAEVH